MQQELVMQENVKGVVSMNEDYELSLFSNTSQDWQQRGIKFLQLQTRDMFETPCQEKLKTGVKFINDIIEETNGSGTVYVHCKAGRTRSAMLVGCYLMARNKCCPEEAVEIMKSKRPHIWLGSQQWAALNVFYKQMVPTSRSADH